MERRIGTIRRIENNFSHGVGSGYRKEMNRILQG
jgi:hypothetical protein